MSEVIKKPQFSYNNFMTDKMSDFWDRVSNKRGMEIILNMYIELSSILLKKLYQINSESSLEDIVPFNIRTGMIINLDQRQSAYTKIEVPSDEKVKSIPEVHSNLRYPKIIYSEGDDYEVVNDDGDIYIDFSKANPEILRTKETGTGNNPYIYFPIVYTEDERIYKNYGEAVDLKPENIEGVEGIEDKFYRNGVQALWKAMYTGPTISSIRQAMYVLHGLPFNQESGVIEEINRVGLLEEGQASVTVNGGIGRESFKLQLREEDVVEIDDSGVDTYLGFDVSDKNILTFGKIHDVNLIDENMIAHEDVKYGTLDEEIYRYENSDKMFYIKESALGDGSKEVSKEGDYLIDSNYGVVKNDPNNDGSLDTNETFESKWIRVFYNHRKTGEERTYELPESLTVHDDISKGDFIEKFSLFSDQLEIQDYAADGGTRGETAGKRIWLQNGFPFGQFTVRSGQELDVPTVLNDVQEFLDFLKPAYSDYTFQLQINPTNAHVFGRIFPDEIIVDMVEQTDQDVINLGNIGRLTDSLYNSITFVGDQMEQTGYSPLPMWDQKEYFEQLLSDVQNNNVAFEDGFYNTDIMSYDNHIEYMNDKGFYDGFQFWDQGAIVAETKTEAQNLADDLDDVTWEEIFYPPDHPDGKLVTDETKVVKWDLGHIDKDVIKAWDDNSIQFDEGLKSGEEDKLDPDYNEDDFSWNWDDYGDEEAVANRNPFTYIFDGDDIDTELSVVLEGLWDDINAFYDLRSIFLDDDLK